MLYETGYVLSIVRHDKLLDRSFNEKTVVGLAHRNARIESALQFDITQVFHVQFTKIKMQHVF